MPWQSRLKSVISRFKSTDKKRKYIQNSQEYQFLFPLNETVVYKTNHGFIINDTNKVKILHCQLLYKNPDSDICTHMVLYLDHAIVIGELVTIQQVMMIFFWKIV